MTLFFVNVILGHIEVYHFEDKFHKTSEDDVQISCYTRREVIDLLTDPWQRLLKYNRTVQHNA